MSIDGKTWPPGTTWDHGDHNGRHERFSLSCDEYRLLLARADKCCEICGIENLSELVIDHDHSVQGGRSVRGLLCPRCNISLAYVDNNSRTPSAREASYLSTPFYKSIPAYRLRLPKGLAPFQKPTVGRFGQAPCSYCRRVVNLDEVGKHRGHNVRVGVEGDVHGVVQCRGWLRWKPMVCIHGSSILDRAALCTSCWSCNCTSKQAPNCPQHGTWTANLLPPLVADPQSDTDMDKARRIAGSY